MTILNYKFFKKIAAFRFVDAIWLYGSRARGDNSERSDIDIAIVCPNACDSEWDLINDIVEEADTLLEIDCIRFDKLKQDATIRDEILRDKKVLYSRLEGNMSAIYTGRSFEALEKVIFRLNKAISNPDLYDPMKADFIRDSVVQRFEFTLELFWKVLKKYIFHSQGKETSGPKNILSIAFTYKIIDDEKIWLDMIDDRNALSHTYDELLTIKIVDNIIGRYFQVLLSTYEKLKDQIKEAQADESTELR